jgi:hypothetical protein
VILQRFVSLSLLYNMYVAACVWDGNFEHICTFYSSFRQVLLSILFQRAALREMRFSARKLFPDVGRSAGGENRRNLGVCNFLHPAGTTAAHEMAVNDSMPNLAFIPKP